VNDYTVSRDELQEIARRLRIESLKMVYKARSGHCGGPLSCADIIAVLYWRFLNVRPNEPRWPDRDRFVLSKGHSCPVYYAALCLRGFFDRSHLDTLRQLDTILQGHPSMKHTPGCDMSTGSLGQGLSTAGGMALGARHQHRGFRVYALLSCGEMDEGMTWEAAMAIRHYNLDNLAAIVDYNKLQLDGANDEVMRIEPLAQRWDAWGWNVIELDGHDIDSITGALERAKDHHNGPTVLIAHTVKGKGVSFMENVCEWHGKVPNEEEFQQAMKELEAPREVTA